MSQVKYMRRGANRSGLLALIESLPADTPNLTMVEVGSYAGESAELFADSGKFGRIYCVDSWAFEGAAAVESRFDEMLQRTNEAHAPNRIRLSQPRIGPGLIVKLKGTSKLVSQAMRVSQIDFAYIDASHTYENVLADIRAWLPRVKRGGWIGGHDYNWKFPGVIRAVFEELGNPWRVFEDTSWLLQKS